MWAPGALMGCLLTVPVQAAEPAGSAARSSTPTDSGPVSGYHEKRRQTFDLALRELEAQNWQKARELFAQLWMSKPSYDVALNLGLAEYNLGSYREAAEYLAYGLENLPPREKPEMAARAEQILELCRRRLGTLKLELANDAAEVLVDDRVVPPVARVADLFVMPGTHRFEVRLPGFEPERWTLSLRAGERQRRSVVLLPERGPDGAPPLVSASAPGAAPTASANASERGVFRGWTPVAVGGAITVLGAGAGLVLQWLRDGQSEEAETLRRKVGDGGCYGAAAISSDCVALRDANRSYDLYGRFELGSFVLSGFALVGTATYFFVVRPDRDSAATHGPAPALTLVARASSHSNELIVQGVFP